LSRQSSGKLSGIAHTGISEQDSPELIEGVKKEGSQGTRKRTGELPFAQLGEGGEIIPRFFVEKNTADHGLIRRKSPGNHPAGLPQVSIARRFGTINRSTNQGTCRL
jgi:hypothetical protein